MVHHEDQTVQNARKPSDSDMVTDDCNLFYNFRSRPDGQMYLYPEYSEAIPDLSTDLQACTLTDNIFAQLSDHPGKFRKHSRIFSTRPDVFHGDL